MNDLDGSAVQAVLDGSLERVLGDVTDWLGRFISVTDDLDIPLLALWAAHTHVALETYSSPRLIIDSSMPGSGKTTVLEHLQRFSFAAVQAAAISSPALLARMLDKGIRTILIDEADRALDPKNPATTELMSILNSGYKRGNTRPVLVPTKEGWEASEMPTYGPVAMAGNAPQLPDDTRSRSIRVLLMPDLTGDVEPSDWEDLEEDAASLKESLAAALELLRVEIKMSRPELPDGCIGRMREKWGPLMRVAVAAGGSWPTITRSLIERDLHEAEHEREDGMSRRPPAVELLHDLSALWPEEIDFLATPHIIEKLKSTAPDSWAATVTRPKGLTAQAMGRMLSQSFKIFAGKNSQGTRGYHRSQFVTAWRRFGLTPSLGTVQDRLNRRTVNEGVAS